MRKRHQPDRMSLRECIAGSREQLYRVALAWSNDEMLADDPVQETVAASIAKREQLRDPSKVSAWLYTILSNKRHQYLQQKKLLYDTLDD